MSEKRNEIGENIKNYRKEAGMTQEELAEKVGITRAYLSEIERGKKDPSYSKVKKISDILGIPIDELTGKEVDLEDLPESLEKFVERENPPKKDIVMLSNIEYRGNQPKTVKDWKTIYNVIKSVNEE